MKPVTHLLTAGLIAASFGLCACNSTQVSRIPDHAEQVASANGDTLYRTSDAGMIYVYDKTSNKLVYTGAVQPDQIVKVDPENSRVLIDDHVVAEQTPIGNGDHFEIYIDTHAVTADTTTTVERRTVTEREIHD